MLFRKTIIFTILLIGVVYCQSWKIYTVDNSIIKFDNLSTVQNDTLFGIEYGDVNEVPVKNILRVSYRKTSSVRRGMMGGCIGLPLGILIGLNVGYTTNVNDELDRQLGAIIGAIIGPIIGFFIFLIPYPTQVPLYDMTLEQKVDKINTLIEIYEK